MQRRTVLNDMPGMTVEELQAQIARFNDGELRLDPQREADVDPAHDLQIAKLTELFDASAYFDKRYRADFDRHVFAGGRPGPYFLFLNLHMCMVAYPDPGLFERWWLKTLMLNAQRRSARLAPAKPNETVRHCLSRNSKRLELRHDFADAGVFLKNVFDNRFYDANFRAMWRYLEGRGLLRDTAVVVASDHGMSFSENGEEFQLHGGARPNEYITRVPLLFHFPAGWPEAAQHGRYPQKVSLRDVFATIAELGTEGTTAEGRGVSLLRRLREQRFDATLVTETSMRPNKYDVRPALAGYTKAVYSGDLKLTYCPEPRVGGRRWPFNRRLGDTGAGAGGGRTEPPFVQLFDLRSDPHERVDLAPQRPEEVRRLRGLVSDWTCQSTQQAPTRAPEWDSETITTLRQLGYIE